MTAPRTQLSASATAHFGSRRRMHGAMQQCERRMPSRRKRKARHKPMVAVPGQG